MVFFVLVPADLFVDLRGEMELDRGVVGPLGIQKPFALGQIDGVAVFVVGDIGVFEPGEILQLPRVFTGDPAGLVKRQGVKLDRSAVLVQ